NLASTHVISLTGLTATTEYVYYFEVTDAFNNTARHPTEGYLDFTTKETITTTTTTTTTKTTTTTTTREAIPGFDFATIFIGLNVLLILIVNQRRRR
ncbi:MAG: hypothetical protein JSV04_04365, partial [Candidatus Heimdallarchaeota archaeon]